MVTYIVFMNYIFFRPETKGRSLQVREEGRKDAEETEVLSDEGEEDVKINLNINFNRKD